MDRRTLRENTFKMLFEADFRGSSEYDEIFENESNGDEYIKKVYYGVLENRDKLDAEIEKNARGWKLSRISKVSLIVMRLSVYEMLNVEDIPFAVSINEAVELVKKYDDEKAPKFVNGVLNSIAVCAGLKEQK